LKKDNLVLDIGLFAAPDSKEIKGLEWHGAAIGTASWSGVLLRDVLKASGLDAEDASVSHVQVSLLTSVLVPFANPDKLSYLMQQNAV
jgi:hypothetical protein